jgi:1-deoxy-D-xylulose-5-phosphate synthase
LGDFFSIGEKTISLLKDELGFQATLINPRYITGLDVNLLDDLKANHQVVVTLEDGILDGGYGQKVASYYGKCDMKVINYGFKKEFIDRYNAQSILEQNGITPGNIVKDVMHVLNAPREFFGHN